MGVVKVATSRWIYRLLDGVYLRGGFYDPGYDPTTESLDAFIDERHPDPRTERGPGRRPATAQEITDYDAAQTDAQADAVLTAAKVSAAFVIWHLNQHHAMTLATVRQAVIDGRAQIKTIYKAL